MSKALTPSLSKAARILLGWSQKKLSEKSDVGLRSITRFEADKSSGHETASAREKLYDAYTKAGIQFIATNSQTGELDGVGLRFKPNNPFDGIKIL